MTRQEIETIRQMIREEMAPITRNVLPELLNTQATSERIGVTVGTLNNWRVSGKGPKFIKVGGSVMYLVSDLMDYIDEQRRMP